MKKNSEKNLLDRIRAFQRSDKANKRCADCTELGPTYVCMTFGTFVCTTCSGLHREFSHKVKGISVSKFSVEEVEELERGGNAKAFDIWMARWEPRDCPEPDNSEQGKVREFLRQKYVDKKWVDRAGGERRRGDRDSRNRDEREKDRDVRDTDRDRRDQGRSDRDRDTNRDKDRDSDRDRDRDANRDRDRDRDRDTNRDRDRDRDRSSDRDRRDVRDKDAGVSCWVSLQSSVHLCALFSVRASQSFHAHRVNTSSGSGKRHWSMQVDLILTVSFKAPSISFAWIAVHGEIFTQTSHFFIVCDFKVLTSGTAACFFHGLQHL